MVVSHDTFPQTFLLPQQLRRHLDRLATVLSEQCSILLSGLFRLTVPSPSFPP